MDNRNQMIDLIKFIFSICIIAIHVSLFKDISSMSYYTLTMGIFRLAVPFFFVVSGYFYYKKIREERSIKNNILKIIKVFFIVELIEILIYTPILVGQKDFSILLYLWKIFSTGLGTIYWYVTSFVISLIILIPFWKKRKIGFMFIIGLILYLIAMTNDSYGLLFVGTHIQKLAIFHTQIWTYPQAGLCSSVLFLSIGAYIEEKRIDIKNVFIPILIFIVLLLGESYYLQSHQAFDANCYFTLIFLAPLLLIWCLQYSKKMFDTRIFGQMSFYVYMIHPIVLNIICFIFPFFSSLLLFLVISVLTLFISYIIVKKQYIKNKV